MFDQALNMPLILAVDFSFQKKTRKYSAIDNKNGASLTNNLKSWFFYGFLITHRFCWFLGPYLPSNLCDGKATGNHELRINGYLFPNHFLQCVHGIEYCQPCAYNNPFLIYSKDCDQCLFPGYYGKCSAV